MAVGGWFGQFLPIAGSIVLFMILVALGAYAYKQIVGEGVEWPDDVDEEGDSDELQSGDQDDEWDYY